VRLQPLGEGVRIGRGPHDTGYAFEPHLTGVRKMLAAAAPIGHRRGSICTLNGTPNWSPPQGGLLSDLFVWGFLVGVAGFRSSAVGHLILLRFPLSRVFAMYAVYVRSASLRQRV
jgi:hypothetical protein